MSYYGIHDITVSAGGRLHMALPFRKLIAAQFPKGTERFPLVCARGNAHAVDVTVEAAFEAVHKEMPHRFADAWLVSMNEYGVFTLPEPLREHLTQGQPTRRTPKMLVVGHGSWIEFITQTQYDVNAVEAEKCIAAFREKLEQEKRTRS